MSVDVNGGASKWVERAEQIETVHCAEAEYHLVPRHDDERLQNIKHKGKLCQISNAIN